MHIQEKLSFLKNCTQQQRSQYSQITFTHPDLLKSCLYQINSLNQTISRQLPFLQESSSNMNSTLLPLIKKKHTRSSQNFSPKTLMFKATLLLKNDKSKVSGDSLVPLSTISDTKTSQKQKEKKLRTRLVRQPHLFLRKEQRYFQVQDVQVLSQDVKKLGLYESTNIFKAKNLSEQLNQLTIVAQKPQFNPIKLINSNDIFLTNISVANNGFSLQSFIEQQLSRDKQCQQVIAKCESIRASKQSNLGEMKSLFKEQQIQVTPIYVTFQNYKVVENQQYRLLKAKYLQNWGALLLNLRYFCNCLKQHKIMHFVVKQDKLSFWEGQKNKKKSIEDALALTNSSAPQKIFRIVLAFKDKLKVTVMKRALQRKQCLARWVTQRLKTIVSLKKDKEYKLSKALTLQNKLRDQNFFTQIQVRVPSFSVDLFKRNTTQYMQSFQALYHSLWQPTDTPLVLVLPTINEKLLKLLQNRIKIIRPITIITPQVHEVFPNNLSLASQINFSYQTLSKIEKAITGKQATLYGGVYDNPTQELMLSQFLNAPFCGSLNNNSVLQQKNFFQKVGLRNQHFCIIQPKSSLQDLFSSFTQLCLSNPEEKSWVFKINGEFRGRGIATIKFNPLKHMNRQQTKETNKLTLKQSLRSMLRLKLKINFQNSLYMVEDYLKSFLQKGGVIEELLEVSNTYEICFKKEKNCELLNVFKVYGINFANKVWLSCEQSTQLTSIISNIHTQIQNNNFLGYVSVTLAKCTNNQFTGIDIKFGQTPPSNLTSFIRMVQSKRMSPLGSQAINLVDLPTKRTQKQDCQSKTKTPLLVPQSHRYLFIPTFPFTDINQHTKSLLIEELMHDCWANRKLKITQEGRFYFSLGLDFSSLVVSKQIKKLKKMGVQLVRELTDKTSSLKQYRGKQVVRDVFQYGDVIRAISQIKNDD